MSTRPPRTRAEARASRTTARGGGRSGAGRSAAGRSGGGGGATARSNGSAAPRGRRRWSWKKRILVTLLALGGLGIAGVVTAYALIRIPQPNELATAQASIIYFADGKTELGRLSEIDGNRESVDISRIPKPVQQAMVAAEDRSFYENEGISPKGIARAAWDTLQGSSTAGGGSTITQQYVKNYFLTSDRSLTRKVKEMLISIKIEQVESKDKILENYFNTIYFGRGAHGIQTAARAYFNKDVSKLTASEGALLASVVRAPSAYDPGASKDGLASATKRWNYVLDGMVTMGYLTPEQRLKEKFPAFVKYQPKAQSGPRGYLVQMVRDELIATHKLDESQLSRLGLRIVTTIDAKAQAAAEKAMRDQMPKAAPSVLGGLASIVPGDGAIRAVYAGSDFAKRQQNAVTQDKLQAGSTFKTFTLIAALQSGKVSLKSTFNGSSPQFFKEFEDPGSTDPVLRRGGVNNAGGSSYGRLNVIQATADSVNTVFAQMNIIAGPQNTVRAAHDAGITSELGTNYGNVLGTDYVTVLDMASAYATIAAEGRYAVPYVVTSITTPDKDLDITATAQVREVFAKDLMDDIITALQAPVRSGTATAAQAVGRPAAGKTGTTLSSRSAWFAGFTPQLATAVGLYRPGPDGEELSMKDLPGGVGTINGGSYPARVWAAYMKVALEGTEVIAFPPPANINPDATPPSPTTSSTPSPSSSAPRPTPTPTVTSPPTPTPTDTPSPSPTPSPTGPSGSPSPAATPPAAAPAHSP